MSGLVIDASVTMAWCFESESTPATEALLDAVADQGALVPLLWTHGVTNVLVMAQRRQRLTEAQAARFASLLDRLPIDVAPEWPNVAAQQALAVAHRLTAYDATYLWLAETRGLPLATLDTELRTACLAAGVGILPP